MVKLTEDLILMQSSDSVSVSVSSSVASTPRQQSCSSSGDTNSDPENIGQFQISSPGFRKINCWGCDIDDISIVSQMPDLETIVLSSNAVHDLSPLSSCKKLTQLSLRRNNVCSLSQLLHLKDISSLKTLWLMDNPVAKEDNYRFKVINLLPQVLKLDSRVVTDAERTEAKCLVFEVSSDPIECTKSENNEAVAVGQKDNTEVFETGEKSSKNATPKNTCESPNSQSTNTNPVPIIDVIEDDSNKSGNESVMEDLAPVSEKSAASMTSDFIEKDAELTETPQLLEGYADGVVKTSILNATQAVRQIGMKLYSTPLPNNMAWSSWSNSPALNGVKGESLCSVNNKQLPPLSKTVCAIELLLDTLNKEELNYLSHSISSRLASFSNQN